MSWLREPNAEPIPGYRLIEPLGSGGFGEVWKCEAPGGIYKAIKFVYGNLNSLDVDAVRAEQEKNALMRIKEVRHPFICSLDLIQIMNGELVIVMELADKTLHDLYQECQTAGLIGIPRDDLLRYLRDAAEALDFMHEKHRLQHLDVKPRNLFLVSERVKVADFGLVKHLELISASGLLGGVTPLYASPETFNGKISEHSDQYSLAIVYQELLTGHRPFTGKNVRALAQQHLKEEPDLRALPEAERPLLARSLAKDPNKRFPCCMDLVRALYSARAPVRLNDPKTLARISPTGRPKTLADTLEDMLLDLPPAPLAPPEVENSADRVDLTGPPLEGSQLLEVGDMGVTVAQPDTGALRPTLFIGLGSFGRKALLELRCRFVDRFGDLRKVPILRFLCLDPDPEAEQVAVKGAPEVALSASEVYSLRLKPVGDYRKRIMDRLSEWLPREKLYAMPRSLNPQGSRALGRLAFVDNHQRLAARLRREIQEAANPDAIYQAVTQTGLALRDNTPRVYILCSAAGASSGMLIDLGYAIRRQLQQMRHTEAPMTLFLMCSAPNDPATPKTDLANIHATLTEINHFSDPFVSFSAEYGTEGQRLVEQGPPFGSVYLLPMPHRSPEGLSDVVSHVGSYLFHETTTPLGLRLDQLRGTDDEAQQYDYNRTPFRSLGTYALWFPRGLLLRAASRLSCRKLIESWLQSTEAEVAASPLAAQVSAVCQTLISDPQLHADALLPRIEEATRSAHLTDLGATPAEAVTGLLSTLGEQALQAVAQEDPGNWTRQALNRVRDWVGGCEAGFEINDWRKTRVNRAMHMAAQKVAQECAGQLVSRQLCNLMEHAGARVAAAEFGLSQFEHFCKSEAVAHKEKLREVKARTAQAWQQLEAALADCMSGGGGFRWFGGRSNRKLLQTFMERLTAFARLRLQEEHIGALEGFYVSLHGQLNDQRRDLGFCRQRLRHLQENLDAMPTSLEDDLAATRPGSEMTMSRSPAPSTEAYWEAIRQSSTARVVLPDNEEELERAAVRLLHRLQPDDWVRLDKELHERVLQPRGGLYAACMIGGDITRTVAAPLMDETIRLLGEYLPIMDVAQILGKEFGFSFDDKNALDAVPSHPQLEACTRAYLDRAEPLLSGAETTHHYSFVLLPASPAGRGISHALQSALPELKHVKVPGQSDLMFCRDYGPLTVKELCQIFRQCGQAYNQAAAVPQSSPHARFDILDWTPLDALEEYR